MQETRHKIQRTNAINSATDYSANLSDSMFNPDELLRITENPEKIAYLSDEWFEKDSATEKWRSNAGMSILVKIPEEMLLDEVEQAFSILGTINSLKFMRSEADENMYVAIEFHKWLCNEHVIVDCVQSCPDDCRHIALRNRRLECIRILEGISQKFPAYDFLPFRRYNHALGIYETVNIPCTIYIEKPEDAANTFRLDGPTPSELEREEELSGLISSRIERQTAQPPLLTRQFAISIPQTMDQRLASLEMIIASQQRQLDELKKQLDSKASVSICAVSKNMFLVQDGEYIFVKNMQTSE